VAREPTAADQLPVIGSEPSRIHIIFGRWESRLDGTSPTRKTVSPKRNRVWAGFRLSRLCKHPSRHERPAAGKKPLHLSASGERGGWKSRLEARHPTEGAAARERHSLLRRGSALRRRLHRPPAPATRNSLGPAGPRTGNKIRLPGRQAFRNRQINGLQDHQQNQPATDVRGKFLPGVILRTNLPMRSTGDAGNPSLHAGRAGSRRSRPRPAERKRCAARRAAKAALPGSRPGSAPRPFPSPASRKGRRDPGGRRRAAPHRSWVWRPIPFRSFRAIGVITGSGTDPRFPVQLVQKPIQVEGCAFAVLGLPPCGPDRVMQTLEPRHATCLPRSSGAAPRGSRRTRCLTVRRRPSRGRVRQACRSGIYAWHRLSCRTRRTIQRPPAAVNDPFRMVGFTHPDKSPESPTGRA